MDVRATLLQLSRDDSAHGAYCLFSTTQMSHVAAFKSTVSCGSATAVSGGHWALLSWLPPSSTIKPARRSDQSASALGKGKMGHL